MKKNLIVVALLAVAVVAFGAVGSAYAQGGTPNPGGGYGPGSGTYSGVMHDLMVANLADQLGLSVDALEARLDAGETAYQVALDLGYSADEAIALISAARVATINQAAEQGLMTQEQASWMLSNQSRMGTGTGIGTCDGTGIQNHVGMGHGGFHR